MERQEVFRHIITDVIVPRISSSETQIIESVDKAQEECMRRFGNENEENILRNFQYELVKFSIKIENLRLALVIILKLQLVQLASCLEKLAQEPGSQHKAFDIIANYFQFSHPQAERRTSNIGTTIGQDLSLLNSHFDCHNWHSAFASVESQNCYDKRKDLLNRFIVYKQAICFEEEEKFNEAFDAFEKSHTQVNNIPRVILKQSMAIGQQLLGEYCSKVESMQKFWLNYLLTCARYQEYWQAFKTLGPNSSFRALKLDVARVVDCLPKNLHEFLTELNHDNWFDRKRCDLMVTFCASLDLRTRSAIANIIIEELGHNNIEKVCNGYLILGQFERFLSSSEITIDKLTNLRLIVEYGSNRNLTNSLIEFLIRYNLNRKRIHEEPQTIHDICLKLGLIDEALQIYYDSRVDSRGMGFIVEKLERMVGDDYAIDYFNPIIKINTITRIHDITSKENDRELATNVITVALLSLALFLKKLSPSSSTLNHSIMIFETMFNGVADYFDDLTYDATDRLIKATNSLIVGVKSNLDVLVDSDVIRKAFRHIVAAVAGTCMIEARYKSAAMLYSQIEDNINAVKSLMRTGEISTVVDYAILVRDLTVNRITLNFLRHLEADHKVIEDFIAQSKL